MSAAEPLPRDNYYGFEAGETCDRAGAIRIAKAIEEYWAKRGHNVQIILHEAGFHPALRSVRVDVRSDMIGGYPKSMLASARSQ